jgi:hypothetical protein
MADIRLYSFEHGSLKVVGNKGSKTATGKQKHFFESVEECSLHVEKLIENARVPFNQYVIIEYYDYMRSQIVKVIDSSIKVN